MARGEQSLCGFVDELLDTIVGSAKANHFWYSRGSDVCKG